MRLIQQDFDVKQLDVDRLLHEWRWLCPESVSVIARGGFGDLFLRKSDGTVEWLDVATGRLSKAAENESQFFELLQQPEYRNEWFGQSDLETASEQGLKLDDLHCIGFKIPLVFKESADLLDNAYVADLYEQVSFLGDLHRQIASEPDSEKVRLTVVNSPLHSLTPGRT